MGSSLLGRAGQAGEETLGLGSLSSGFCCLLTSPRASPRAFDHLTVLLEFEALELELTALPQNSLPDKQWLYFYLRDECLTSPVLGSEYLLWSQTLPGRSPGLVRLRALGEH